MYRVSSCSDKKCSKLDTGDGCTSQICEYTKNHLIVNGLIVWYITYNSIWPLKKKKKQDPLDIWEFSALSLQFYVNIIFYNERLFFKARTSFKDSEFFLQFLLALLSLRLNLMTLNTRGLILQVRKFQL